MNFQSRSMPVIAIFGVLTCLMTFSQMAFASNDIDRCNDVLKGDLFNKMGSQSKQAESAQQAQTEYFFTRTSDVVPADDRVEVASAH